MDEVILCPCPGMVDGPGTVAGALGTGAGCCCCCAAAVTGLEGPPADGIFWTGLDGGLGSCDGGDLLVDGLGWLPVRKKQT